MKFPSEKWVGNPKFSPADEAEAERKKIGGSHAFMSHHNEKGVNQKTDLTEINHGTRNKRLKELKSMPNPNLTRSEEMDKNEKIRELQKSGLSPEQIMKRLKKEEECEKSGEKMLTKEEEHQQIRELQKSGLSPEQINRKLNQKG